MINSSIIDSEHAWKYPISVLSIIDKLLIEITLVASHETPVEYPAIFTDSPEISDHTACNPIDVVSDHWASWIKFTSSVISREPPRIRKAVPWFSPIEIFRFSIINEECWACKPWDIPFHSPSSIDKIEDDNWPTLPFEEKIVSSKTKFPPPENKNVWPYPSIIVSVIFTESDEEISIANPIDSESIISILLISNKLTSFANNTDSIKVPWISSIVKEILSEKSKSWVVKLDSNPEKDIPLWSP